MPVDLLRQVKLNCSNRRTVIVCQVVAFQRAPRQQSEETLLTEWLSIIQSSQNQRQMCNSSFLIQQGSRFESLPAEFSARAEQPPHNLRQLLHRKKVEVSAVLLPQR